MLASSGNNDRDMMIKTGEMTPFGTVINRQNQSLERPTISVSISSNKDQAQYHLFESPVSLI